MNIDEWIKFLDESEMKAKEKKAKKADGVEIKRTMERGRTIDVCILNRTTSKYGCWNLSAEEFPDIDDFMDFVTATFEEFARSNRIDAHYEGFELAQLAFSRDFSEKEIRVYAKAIEGFWKKTKKLKRRKGK